MDFMEQVFVLRAADLDFRFVAPEAYLKYCLPENVLNKWGH
jgi:hypothetical protein